MEIPWRMVTERKTVCPSLSFIGDMLAEVERRLTRSINKTFCADGLWILFKARHVWSVPLKNEVLDSAALFCVHLVACSCGRLSERIRKRHPERLSTGTNKSLNSVVVPTYHRLITPWMWHTFFRPSCPLQTLKHKIVHTKCSSVFWLRMAHPNPFPSIFLTWLT